VRRPHRCRVPTAGRRRRYRRSVCFPRLGRRPARELGRRQRRGEAEELPDQDQRAAALVGRFYCCPLLSMTALRIAFVTVYCWILFLC
jgi:hypothetical protein